jgi:hypothetical protein
MMCGSAFADRDATDREASISKIHGARDLNKGGDDDSTVQRISRTYTFGASRSIEGKSQTTQALTSISRPSMARDEGP